MHYGGSVILWAILCSEILHLAIHVDVTLDCTTNLSIVAEHVHLFMETIFPDGCGIFEQYNVLCHRARMV